jgi:hypothetical protein
MSWNSKSARKIQEAEIKLLRNVGSMCKLYKMKIRYINKALIHSVNTT